MKRLWVFAFATILLIGGLGVFGVPKVFAETTVTPEQILQHATPIFDEKLRALQNELTLFAKNHGGINSQEYKDYKLMKDAEISATRDARSIFETTVANGTGPTSDTYFNALVAASRSLADSFATNQQLKKSEAATYIDDFRQELMTEANSQQRIKAIATGEAIDQTAQDNARRTIAAASPSSVAKGGGCTFSNFTISACIDEGFTWLIKNTLLQLGGFFVWLTANMLNYAIQVSVLEFSKWASSSLYPIWLVIRQIVSLFVIFAGLYLGFMYIIGRTETFGKFFGWLVIFALFVNFSYPFSRALVDVSNIISLNVYSAAVGSSALTTPFSTAATTLGDNTAGAQIMNRLGLYGLVGSATEVENKQGDQQKFISGINSVPGALVAVAFVFYAAYIFFIATAIIVTRMVVLIFLTVASPLLLVDSVVPKLGDAAVKMRKMFFEQLAVAPVFMIMLALTLNFMEVFQDGGALGKASSGALTGGGPDSIQTFFSILMMLIMLHIMLKVTKSIAGSAGEYATNFMGKVGGFGLGMATGGAGVLARGTIGAGAARLRDSAWMDKMKSSSVGRGMYGLTNSLAQSTYDVRNVGAVSSTMSKAGLTGLGGYGMQKGIKQGFDERKKSRTDEVVKFGSAIQDDAARSAYFSRANTGRLVRVDPAATREAERGVQSKRESQLTTFAGLDKERRASAMDQAIVAKDYALQEKLKAGEEYLGINNSSPDAAKQKAEALRKLGDDKLAEAFFKNDPLKDVQENYNEEIKGMEEGLSRMKRGTDEEKKLYDAARVELENKKKDHKDFIEGLKKETRWEYTGGVGPRAQTTTQGPQNPSPGSGSLPAGGRPSGPTQPSSTSTASSHPGGSDFSHLNQNDHPAPTVMKTVTNNHVMSDTERSDMKTFFDLHKDSFKETVARRTSSKPLPELQVEGRTGNQPNQGNPSTDTSTPVTVRPTTNPSPTGATVAA